MSATVPVVLYGHWICPYVVRVQFALAQRSIEYDFVEVPPTAVRPKQFVMPEEFLAHSPKREVPMLRIGNAFLADSIPILEWMEREFAEFPMLPPSAEAAARVRERVQWLDQHLYRPMIGIYYGTDEARIQSASVRFGEALGEVARWLSETRWLGGNGVTLAEAIMAAIYVRVDGLRSLGLNAALPAVVEDHHRRCTALPGWRAVAWSESQTREFVKRFTEYRARSIAAQCE